MSKKCGICKKVKSSKEFSTRGDTRKHTLKWACKECLKVEGRLRYREKVKKPGARDKLNKRNRENWKRLFNKNPEKYRKRAREWRKKNRSKTIEYCKNWRIKLRLEVLSAYGGRVPECVCCGVTDTDFLAVDHINGGGNKHQVKLRGEGKLLYLELRKKGFPKGYQIMCHNCNYKKYLRGQCYCSI